MGSSSIHPSHPEHELELRASGVLYKCDGCKMQGSGKRYRCDVCDYNLHEDCMFPSLTFVSNPFFQGSALEFFYEPQPGSCNDQSCHKCIRYCDACAKPIHGFNYHCRAKGKDLHPCCSKLKKKLEVDGVKFQLHGKVDSACQWCKKKRLSGGDSSVTEGFSYISECKKFHFHVYCTLEMELMSMKTTSGNLAIQSIDTSMISRARRSGGSGWSKFVRILMFFVKAVVGVLLGDPSAIVTSFLVELISQ